MSGRIGGAGLARATLSVRKHQSGLEAICCALVLSCRTKPPLSWRETWYELMRGWPGWKRSPVIDYIDDWPGWKIRIDRFTRLRAAAVLHSARLLLSTFITHRRRLLIRYCGQAGRLAAFCVLAINRAFSLSSFSNGTWLNWLRACLSVNTITTRRSISADGTSDILLVPLLWTKPDSFFAKYCNKRRSNFPITFVLTLLLA